MRPILFTIVLPTYNRAHMLSVAIDSVINQNYDNWELVIIDDGSADNTKEVVDTYNDVRIVYLYQENKGKGLARNKGVERAKGDYVCFLDSDDEYLQNHLATFYEMICLRSPYSIYRTGAIIYEDITKKDVVSFRSIQMTEETRDYQIKFIWDEVVALWELAIELSVAKSILSTNCDRWQDKHYIIRLVLNYPIKQIRQHTVVINDHRERSVRVDILTKEQREAPFKCMDDLIKKHPEVELIVGKEHILKRKLWSAYGQIYNLLADKKVGIAYRYHLELLLEKPVHYTIYKSLVLYYRVFINFFLYLFGKKGKYF